jgi:hypothetical protein
MKIVITKVGKDDAFYKDRKKVIGTVLDVTQITKHPNGYSGLWGKVISSASLTKNTLACFHNAKFKIYEK